MATTRSARSPCELERDPAAERIADQDWRVQTETIELAGDRIGQSARRRPHAPIDRRARAEAGKVERDHVMACLERPQHRLPGPPRETEAMKQNERPAGAAAMLGEGLHEGSNAFG
jgi:hypothetical protein